jgi:hypothetical protein
MSALLKEADRETLRRIARRAQQIVDGRVRWEARVLQELEKGPSTRLELLSIIRSRFTREDQKAMNDAIRRLIAKGKLRERPMIEPGGRAVRVEPVMVLELVR